MYEKRFELVNTTSGNATLLDKVTDEIHTWNVQRDKEGKSFAFVLVNNRKCRIYLYKLTEEYKHKNETIEEERKRLERR